MSDRGRRGIDVQRQVSINNDRTNSVTSVYIYIYIYILYIYIGGVILVVIQ